jgi:hypothetical protein
MRPLVVSLLLAGTCLAGLPAAAQPGVPMLAPSRAVECMTPPAAVRGKPDYPAMSLSAKAGGLVRVELVFNGPDVAPVVRVIDPNAAEVTILAAEPDASLIRSVQALVAGYRLPCLHAAPVESNLLFSFLIDGRPGVALKDLPLVQLLGAAKDLPGGTFFDTAGMGCPFDVRLTYYRPHALNVVRELESSNPARAPLLDWLAAITLNLDPSTNTALLGDTLNVRVPCLKIDL